jgi:hypothetical protein
MRLIQRVTFPEKEFNEHVRNGTAASTMGRILETVRPEAAYFTLNQGHRCAVLIVDVKDASQYPALAEPWFLAFNATCDVDICMSPEDLQKAGLDKYATGKTKT